MPLFKKKFYMLKTFNLEKLNHRKIKKNIIAKSIQINNIFYFLFFKFFSIYNFIIIY